MTAYSDLGGFGVAAHVDWQVVGTLDYTLKPWVALRLGYRSLNVTASGNDLGYNIHMKGPILGAHVPVLRAEAGVHSPAIDTGACQSAFAERSVGKPGFQRGLYT
jgi:hypothetical protein